MSPRRVVNALIPVLAAALVSVCRAQSPEPNLDVLRSVAGRIAGEVAAELALPPHEILSISVLPRELGWAVDQGIIGAFAPGAAGRESAAVEAVFGIRDAQVSYGEVEREGWFGPRTVGRKVGVTLSVRVTRTATGAVILSRDIAGEQSDRILLSDIPAVEHPTLAMARGVPPSEGFVSGLGEPVILIGAIGVAVFLLFHVRS